MNYPEKGGVACRATIARRAILGVGSHAAVRVGFHERLGRIISEYWTFS